ARRADGRVADAHARHRLYSHLLGRHGDVVDRHGHGGINRRASEAAPRDVDPAQAAARGAGVELEHREERAAALGQGHGRRRRVGLDRQRLGEVERRGQARQVVGPGLDQHRAPGRNLAEIEARFERPVDRARGGHAAPQTPMGARFCRDVVGVRAPRRGRPGGRGDNDEQAESARGHGLATAGQHGRYARPEAFARVGHPMADVEPLRALHYDQAVAGDLQDLVAPPYDVIDPEQREELAARSPHNVVRVDLPTGDDPYANAAQLWSDWRVEGAVTQDAEPALWALVQDYTGPDGRAMTRNGFFARVRVTDYGPGRIRPHER